MDDQKIIGANLRKARKKRKLTQVELAKLAGVNANYYSQLERGRVKGNISSKTVKKLSEALGIKSSDILPF